MSDSTVYNLLRGTTGKAYSATLPENATYKGTAEFVLDAPHAKGDAFTLSFDVRLSAPGQLAAYLYNPDGNTKKSVYVDGTYVRDGVDGYVWYEAGPEWRHVAITWEYKEVPVKLVDRIIPARMFGANTAVGTTVEVRNLMLVEGTEPAAWAPADGESLAGGGALMSANLLDGLTPMLYHGTTEDGGVFHKGATTGHYDLVVWDLPDQAALETNQTYHVGLSVRGAARNVDSLWMAVGYKDASGARNWVKTYISIGTSWGRAEGTLVVPSGMTPFAAYITTFNTGPETWMTAPTLSLGSPVPLASSAHTPYATQDHVAAEYATKAALKVTSDAVTAEVTERGKLAGRVGTLESTSGTHTSRLEQLAASIKSLVKGESTYTDPDGASATSGIYSLVTQTRDSVTALFGQYTKTADLASTQAVKDAKKAGTDAQAAAGAAKSTADSLATLIRADSTGVTVGKSTDGKTWSTGRTRMTDSAFEVLDKAGKVLASFGGNVVSLLGGILTIAAGQGGVGSIYTADGNSLFLKSGKDAEVSDNRGSYIEVNDVFASLNSKPAGGTMNSLMVNNDGIFAQTQGASGLMLGPVHSMYNQYNGAHVYTGKASEISDLKSIGWTDEGVKFYAFLGIDNR